VRQAIISDGCIISDATIERAVVGLRSIIKSGSTIKNSVVMGADYYEELRPAREGEPALGIGSNCVVDMAIVDKNARIGNGAVITPDGKEPNCDGPPVRWSDGGDKPVWYVRDGIVIIPKGAVIPDGMWV
jgi:glucose-1-phosphate adenylyltransferase